MQPVNYFQILCVFFSLSFCTSIHAQTYSNDYIKNQISLYKTDERGPYRDIRWFCEDGSIRQPKDPCPNAIGPGVQHARYKEVVEKIGEKEHVFLGQILAYTSKEALWDENYQQSRLKQYQLGKYLYSVANGWVLEKAQYYRGAIQVEDEEAAGKDFFKWVLGDDSKIRRKFFLIRESLKDVPHSGDSNLAQLMRSQSKTISDELPLFMGLRIKIHGQPDEGDIEKVKVFQQKNQSKISGSVYKQIDDLIATMNQFYNPIDGSKIAEKTDKVTNASLKQNLDSFQKNTDFKDPASVIEKGAQLLLELRENLTAEKNVLGRLQLLDRSLKVESLIFKEALRWEPKTLEELIQKIYYLGMANAGTGSIELWEWETIEPVLRPKKNETLSLGTLTELLETARGEVEWGASMVKALYLETVNRYDGFEPKSRNFIDDRIRGSLLLALGKSVAELGHFLTNEAQLKNSLLDFSNTTSFRGLNPGYAFGELEVVEGNPESVEVVSNKIYIFQRPPSDLKPVAGIATVEEGNMVSHVQLLARNLGIPNMALSAEDLKRLKKFDGQKIFYAVSNKGTVIMKLEADMTLEEKKLFERKERKEEKIEVPVQKMQLNVTHVLNMREVDAASSGIVCGPKAANLGQLKKMFPEHVVEGLVIPFGIFRSHMDQPMPGQATTYWEYLTKAFEEADQKRNSGSDESAIELFLLERLAVLREAIKDMPLRTDFKSELEHRFQEVFKAPMGKVPVFLRSDTNMEDLKDFTGAGLNLTLFNVVDSNKIWEGIKSVWASPYSDRSFKWRQKYLSNPENVFPSILIIPSVDVDYSGVMITKGIRSGINEDITVAFSRGAGGAVDGQIAETYLIRMDESYQLLSPAREPYYNSLPLEGGTQKNATTFEEEILSKQNIHDLCELASQIREKMEAMNAEYVGAYDVELGFKKEKIWLFQIRPFVENKKALSSDYLEAITPTVEKNKLISIKSPL
ncbi:MAG TPA: PEP/pyruvate-binding domain-containing protein [Flavobacteriaceae bacterium]|nr:phosphoenolpyruvate synthase [Flavobacteriaceae bacterium]MCB9213848.1 phosphoenolpyruvate synthase [Alteromonas sp.]HPF11244.1 PEP/pyruvate-binding domain-containing protein [Flavobacteriaceae bacterium]HQU21723.1 PEP/pyruvate-binding domain-containing protein [Flavobacteriaceae bacterium]HQU64537.1 PEP/pyruvate-binding domain-containing protein [Flavobacteriaceae bacterium]